MTDKIWICPKCERRHYITGTACGCDIRAGLKCGNCGSITIVSMEILIPLCTPCLERLSPKKPTNEYRPWEATGETKAEYFKRAYMESVKEWVVETKMGWQPFDAKLVPGGWVWFTNGEKVWGWVE